MLVKKEIIRDGTYWYVDERTGLPRKLVVTPELRKHWHERGNEMLSLGLTVPVPYEHDFNAHPMTPKEKLLNTAGEVKEYRNDNSILSCVVDIQDPAVKSKIGRTIRWTSPWFSSFPDGNGRQWDNVISHLALTTRPRIIKQEPFPSIAAALSMATEVKIDPSIPTESSTGGYCLSRAGLLDGEWPAYPMAFSLWGGGIPLATAHDPESGRFTEGYQRGQQVRSDQRNTRRGKLRRKIKLRKNRKSKGVSYQEHVKHTGGLSIGDDDEWDEVVNGDDYDYEDDDGDADGLDLSDPLADANGDVAMEELLCDLLQALGVPMPDESNEAEFKRHLYEAAMSKIKELTSKGMGQNEKKDGPDQNKPPNQNPHTSQPNPLIGQVQQEQQPMYMSLEEINKLPDPMKGVALAMYAENQKLRGELEANSKATASLRDAKLKEESTKRQQRITLLGKLSPSVKADLDAMLALPSMALSMGEGGVVVDPMAQTLAVLEKGLADMPRLLTTDRSALSVQPQPQDSDVMTEVRANEVADEMSRRMGYPPQAKAS